MLEGVKLRNMRARVPAWIVFVVTGTLGGFVGTGLAVSRVVSPLGFRGDIGIGFIDAVLTRPFSIAAGMLSGALVGFLVWTLLRPRRHISRLTIVLVALNCSAWLLCLVLMPRVTDSDTDPIQRQRAEFDEQVALGFPNGLDIVHHPPMLLAGREFSGISLSEKPVVFMAIPAILFVQEQTVPDRYDDTGPTVRESHWIAAIAFVVSTSWWVTVASVLSWLRQRSARGGKAARRLLN